MTTEQRAALERLRSIRVDDLSSGWEDHLDSHEIAADVITATYLALAEHPADDDKPITAGRAKAIGFTRHMQPAANDDVSLEWAGSLGTNRISLYFTKWRALEAVALSDGDVSEYIPDGIKPKTMGQLRRLVAALGGKPIAKGVQ